MSAPSLGKDLVGLQDLTAEQKNLLRKLADGGMDEQTRATLIPLLAKNEVAMEFLAEATT